MKIGNLGRFPFFMPARFRPSVFRGKPSQASEALKCFTAACFFFVIILSNQTLSSVHASTSIMKTTVLLRKWMATIVKAQKHADITWMLIIALRGENPMARNLWWMCDLSGMNSGLWLRARRSTTRTTSRQGIINTLNDTSTGLLMGMMRTAGSYMLYLITKKLRMKPSVRLPVSPMKIFPPPVDASEHVVGKEGDDDTHAYKGKQGERPVAEVDEQDAEHDQRDHAQSRSQSVDSVDQVDGVGDEHHQQDGERDADGRIYLIDAEKAVEAVDIQSGQREHGSCENLHEEFLAVAHAHQVVAYAHDVEQCKPPIMKRNSQAILPTSLASGLSPIMMRMAVNTERVKRMTGKNVTPPSRGRPAACGPFLNRVRRTAFSAKR